MACYEIKGRHTREEILKQLQQSVFRKIPPGIRGKINANVKDTTDSINAAFLVFFFFVFLYTSF
jgi:hypothetical protein